MAASSPAALPEQAVAYRRLDRKDGAAFREIRLMALQAYPDNYTSTHAEEAALDPAFHAGVLEQHLAYGAFIGEKLVATMVAERHVKRRLKHKCSLSAVFVLPQHQGQGIGRSLLTHLLRAAAGEFERAMIAVDTNNEIAIHLYESLGFTPFAIEPHALKEEGRYLDDLWMLRDLGDLVQA